MTELKELQTTLDELRVTDATTGKDDRLILNLSYSGGYDEWKAEVITSRKRNLVDYIDIVSTVRSQSMLCAASEAVRRAMKKKDSIFQYEPGYIYFTFE